MISDVQISTLRKAVRAAKTQEQRTDTLEILDSVTAKDSAYRAEIWYLIGRLHRENGHTTRALEAFAHADIIDNAAAEDGLGRSPPWTCAEHAKLLLTEGLPEKAAVIAKSGIASGRTSPSLLSTLAYSALDVMLPIVEAKPLLQDAILANPSDRLLVERWFDRMREDSSAELASQELKSMQEESPNLLHGVLTVLASINGRSDLRQLFAEKFVAASKREPFLQIERTWQDIIEGRTPEESDLRIVAREQRSAELFFHFIVPPPRQLSLTNCPSSEAELKSLRVRVPELRKFVHDFLHTENKIWKNEISNSKIRHKEASLFMLAAEASSAFMDRIVDLGKLSMIDPLSGRTVDCHDSYIAFGRSIYSFRGQELFFLVCGRHWNSALGLYIPSINVSIIFEDFLSKFQILGGRRGLDVMGEGLANVLAVLLSRVARDKPNLPIYSPPAERHELALSVPSTENFAHHVWNFYSAIERLIRTRQIKRFSKIYFSGTEFFGPLEDIFPELAEIGVERPKKSNVVDPFAFNPQGIVLQAGGFFVAESLTQRIIETIVRRPRVSLSIAEPHDYPSAAQVPVFWFGLRLGDKAWIDQEDGIVRAIDVLAKRYPDALFLIDGFSYPIGIDSISEKWTKVIAELKGISGRIKDRTIAPKRVIDMIGNTMRESVLWAQVTDVYLAPYGTTQHKIGWFSKAAGLVYLSSSLESPERVALSPACSAVEYSPLPDFLFVPPVSAGERRGANRQRERLANVSLDANQIADRLTIMFENKQKMP